MLGGQAVCVCIASCVRLLLYIFGIDQDTSQVSLVCVFGSRRLLPNIRPIRTDISVSGSSITA